ncbi:hypothetical protein F511_01245 [Dorcoceras hygrometricum]|uniref:Uncharacterized protein n=1 Tax=Dorcoceras hygrometricum TaxID=472368 RepID=A0A2Z7BYQ1_9LAMI|nr:hypothetical protein F511_01245 [Dorcoceras hygrometricum]
MDTLHFETIHHTNDQEDDETLSLCDLPLYTGDQSDDWENDLSSQESSSSSEENFFEFFSQEYINPPPPGGIPPANIIFCGKLIPYKQTCSDSKSSSESRKQEAHNKNQQVGSSNSTSDSDRCVDSRNGNMRAIPLTLIKKKDKDRHVSSPLHYSSKKVKGHDFPAQKFPVMAPSSSAKAKWYLFFLGTSSFKSAVEPSGLNSRRSSRQSPPRGGGKNISDDRDRGWRDMGGLIGALSCGVHLHADTMVAASIGHAPLK